MKATRAAALKPRRRTEGEMFMRSWLKAGIVGTFVAPGDGGRARLARPGAGASMR